MSALLVVEVADMNHQLGSEIGDGVEHVVGNGFVAAVADIGDAQVGSRSRTRLRQRRRRHVHAFAAICRVILGAAIWTKRECCRPKQRSNDAPYHDEDLRATVRKFSNDWLGDARAQAVVCGGAQALVFTLYVLVSIFDSVLGGIAGDNSTALLRN